MKKKLLFAFLTLFAVGALTGCGEKKEEKKEEGQNVCTSITGGSFLLLFNTNGGDEMEPISVCIACSPTSYEEIPVPKKEGATFEGWYYDEELTQKVEVESTLHITPVPVKNDSGCITGYEDIKIHAKWN